MRNILCFKTVYLLVFLFCNTLVLANEYDPCCTVNECCAPAYDCGDPLNCGSVNFVLRAGVAPILWKDRGQFSAFSCNALAIPGFSQTTINFFKMPRFSKFFRVPWIVGGQIGYALSDNVEIYLEANYRAAKNRNFSTTVTVPNDTVNISFEFQNNYRIIDAYVGARYYWGRCWCDQVAFFVGAKFGLVHHKPVCFRFLIASVNGCPAGATPVLSPGDTPFFSRNTTPASGLNFGFDWCLGCGWSLMLMAEAVASCGPHGNSNIAVSNACNALLPTFSPTNLGVGHIGTELFFPITLGLKYSF